MRRNPRVSACLARDLKPVWSEFVGENRLNAGAVRNRALHPCLSIGTLRWTSNTNPSNIPLRVVVFSHKGFPQTTLQGKVLRFFGLGFYLNYVKDLAIDGHTVCPGPLCSVLRKMRALVRWRDMNVIFWQIHEFEIEIFQCLQEMFHREIVVASRLILYKAG